VNILKYLKKIIDLMKEKIDRLLAWVEKKRVGPLSLEIWPTNRCNLKCIMCGTWASRRKAEEKGLIYDPEIERKRELPDEVWLKIVEGAIQLGVKEFLITGGGEPLVRKDTTFKLMEKIKGYGAYGMLNTNGTLFSSSDIEKVISLGWDLIIFSVDAPNAKLHDFIRNVKGTFNKVKEVLLEFKKQKKKLKTDKPKIVFNTVVLNKNFEILPKLIKFAKSVGCEDITFIPLISFDESVEKYKLDSKQKLKFNKILAEIENLSKKFGINTNARDILNFQINEKMYEVIKREIESLPSGFAFLPCYEPFLHLLITPEGEATCCCMLAGKGKKVDFKKENLEKIWFSDWFNELRQQFLKKELPVDCGNCVFSQFIRNKEIRNQLQKILT
jgi:MoaA/NifB/PqqE/SkfB family radical SAM enzyme